MKRNLKLSVIVMVLAVAEVCLAASSTQMINYQGRLTDIGGAPVSGSTVSVTFSIYGAASGTTALWTETQSVSVAGGVYSVELGAANPISDDLFKAPSRWLGVKVRTDPEMTPRARITSAAYAMNSKRIGGKKIQSGQETLTVAGVSGGAANITFPVPFASVPQVMIGALDGQIGGKTVIATEVVSLSATGCAVWFLVLDASAVTGSANFDWIAIGE